MFFIKLILLYLLSWVSSGLRTLFQFVSAYSIAGCRSVYLRQLQRNANNQRIKKGKRTDWCKFSIKWWRRKFMNETIRLLKKYGDFILVSSLATFIQCFMTIGIHGNIGLVLMLLLTFPVQCVNAESTSDEESSSSSSEDLPKSDSSQESNESGNLPKSDSSQEPNEPENLPKSDYSQEPNESKKQKRLRYRHHGYLNNVADPNQM